MCQEHKKRWMAGAYHKILSMVSFGWQSGMWCHYNIKVFSRWNTIRRTACKIVTQSHHLSIYLDNVETQKFTQQSIKVHCSRMFTRQNLGQKRDKKLRHVKAYRDQILHCSKIEARKLLHRAKPELMKHLHWAKV